MGGPGFNANEYAKPEELAKKVVEAVKTKKTEKVVKEPKKKAAKVVKEPKKKAATKDKAKAKTKKAQ